MMQACCSRPVHRVEPHGLNSPASLSNTETQVNVQGAGYLRVLVGNVEASDEQLRLGASG